MKIFKKHISVLILSLFLGTSFIACDEGGDPEAGGTAVEALAGEWTVEILRNGSEYNHGHISTYNTAANVDSEMWLDDLENGWGLKAKVNLNSSASTFSGDNLVELYYDVTVTITNGIIVKKGATAPSGTVTDSIHFNAEFSDIPGEIWEYAGHRRTGFLEDE